MSSDLSLTRTSTTSSTTPLTQQQQQQQPKKDYAAAFANLQSSYGMGQSSYSTGGGPGLPKPAEKRVKVKPQKQAATPTAPTTMAPSSSSSQQPPAAGQKNYEHAFGNLASSYGYGGTVPTPTHNSQKTQSSSSAKSSFASRGPFSLLFALPLFETN